MNNNKELIELKETNKNNTKLLLIVEIFLLITSISSFAVLITAADYLSNTNNILKFSLISTAILILTLSIIFSFIIEKEAGYHECKKCHHIYKPTYKQLLFAMHICWTKYLKCPKCHQRSWSKKVLSK